MRNNKGQFVKGMVPHNKGKRNLWMFGEKNPNWRGGKKILCVDCGKILNTRDRKKKRCRACWKKWPDKGGENSGVWRGGVWEYWQKQALKRDNYTCQRCGFKHDIIMCVDHIKPKSLFPELLLVLSNLQTLCPNCHAIKTIEEHKIILKIKNRVNSGKPLTDNAEGNPDPSSEWQQMLVSEKEQRIGSESKQ